MSSETPVRKRAEREFSCGDHRLYRQNTGLGWVGGPTSWRGKAVTIQNARPLHAGLCEGSSDLIGWKKIRITEDMVGKDVAVFMAFEAKSKTDSMSKLQRSFVSLVKRFGGIAGQIRTVQDAHDIIAEYIEGLRK